MVGVRALGPVEVGTPTATGHAATKNYVDTTALLTTARGAANGVAPLDSGLLVPIAHLPTGTTSTTVPLGNDSRFTDARTPTAHASTHASAGSDPVTPAAIGALATTARGAANGVASLDSGTKIPIAQVPTGSTSTTVSLGNHNHAISALTGTSISSPSANQVLGYNGTNWVNVAAGLATVSALADITAPATGQLALLTTDSMIYRYTGSAWLAVRHTAAGGGFARYTRTTAQSIPNLTVTKIALTTAVTTHADVSPNGAFDVFTLNRAGVWRIGASLGLQGGSGYARALFISNSDDSTRWDMVQVPGNPGWIIALHVTTTISVSAGQQVAMRTYQDVGSAMDTETAQFKPSLSFYWEGP